MDSNQIQNSYYHLRFMVALAISLALITLCFKIPLRFDPAPKSWRLSLKPHGISTEIERKIYLPPATDIKPIGSNAGTDAVTIESNEIIAHEDTIPEISQPHPLNTSSIPVLNYAEIMPQIQGGLGAYYILIDYPQEAIVQEIEGKVTLTFTVNPDGTVSNILVSHPLHALLDSAAVQALRRTRFIPGRHLGKSARIRMRLPVRFELIDPVDSTRTK
ncbi:MAG: energy transducer TonB [Bacteroidota bacterium]|nr:energy transducer TonB [Bacteroidota bacterium]MXW14907.1 energy transducer TonB [Rhodothermaceae bacterium]MDE2645185.1 energy transducer TonB [Bacteroidota bacterium]MXZ18753.1 energy transducer TonB [Rhodothermaceae bacterium]MYB91861.1 energy transducer TonB [Rhodothermaceae bacterium]